MSNPANKYINEFTRKYTALAENIVEDLQDQLAGADVSDVSAIVNSVFKEYDVEDKYRAMFLDSVTAAVKVSVDIPNVTLFKGYYLKNVKAVDGIRLSSKIQDVTRTDEISSMVKQALRVNDKMQTLSRDLVKNEITQADMPKYLDDVIRLSRQATTITRDSEAAQDLKRAFAKAQRSVDRLVSPDTSVLRRAYRDVIEATQGATEKQLDAAVRRAIMFKARSNAERLTATETTRAYGNARLLEIVGDRDAVGVRVSLSGDHRDIGCVCEYIVEQDWGMGEGVYPVDKLPEYPFHPWCDCVLDPVYEGDKKDFDDTTDPDSDFDWDYNKIYLDENMVEVE